jgi:hypothetical protein
MAEDLAADPYVTEELRKARQVLDAEAAAPPADPEETLPHDEEDEEEDVEAKRHQARKGEGLRQG